MISQELKIYHNKRGGYQYNLGHWLYRHYNHIHIFCYEYKNHYIFYYYGSYFTTYRELARHLNLT